jgi:Fe2+ transport system protein B
MALSELKDADAIVLVLRGTQLKDELRTLLRALDLGARRLAVAITFADKAPAGLTRAAESIRQSLGVPVVALNARSMSTDRRGELVEAIRAARPLTTTRPDESLVQLRARAPRRTPFEHPVAGPRIALIAMVVLLAVPVVVAFKLAAWLQPVADAAVLQPLAHDLANLPPFAAAVLVGPYGLLTLGAYSFIWAFPVVLLLGISTSVSEETGLHDRITSALDRGFATSGSRAATSFRY